MFSQYQFSVSKINYIPWIAIFLIIALFTLIEPLNVYRPATHGQGYDAVEAAEDIATHTEMGSMNRRLGMVVLAFLGVISLWRPSANRVHLNGALGFLLLIFFGWATLSMLWAYDFPLTVRRIAAFGILWLGALGFAYRYPLEDVLWLAFIGSALLSISAIFLELAWGVFTPFSPGYRLAGGIHPNHTAWTCSLFLLSSVVLGGKYPRRRIFFMLSGLLAASLLLLTKSRIAAVSSMIALFSYWFFNSPRRNKAIILLFGASFICLLFIFLQNHLFDYAKTALIMGRTDTAYLADLSGRIPLWQELLRYVSREPLTGYGFNAFWTPKHILEVSSRLSWGVPQAHSDVLDLVLGVGIIGAFLYVVILFISLKTYIMNWLHSYNRDYLFAVSLLISYSLVMLTETIFSSACFPGFIVAIILMKLGLVSPQFYEVGEISEGQAFRELEPIQVVFPEAR